MWEISIEKTADASPVSAGDEIGFSIKVSNTGAGTARDVTVTDQLPDAVGLAWAEDSDDCTIDDDA